MNRFVLILVLLVACGEAKLTEDVITKCNESSHSTWRYEYTTTWYTEEDVYEYHYDYFSGEWKYGKTGTETVYHERDIYSCQKRR